MESMLRGLNATQRAAVTSKASVLQVLAPPGSGKTKTLTSRVAYLLAHEGYRPQNVICCTFTIKASREMRERLRGLVGGDLEGKLVLGTFHSICRRYLVTYGHLIGIPNNFGIADSDDSLGIIKRLQKKIKFGMEPRAARNKISHRKARGQRLDDILKSTGKSMEAQEFAMIFQEYETALATSNLLDYDDLLLKCVELLRKYPQCVSNIEALLIDEFQDTNNVQFGLMKLLASAKRRITIVGDPDQSIYGFRSAEIENLNRMQAYYPGTVVINLEENYRSSSAVLNLAQDVIEQDEERPSKRLKSTHCHGTLPVLRRVPNPHEEAAWLVSEVKRMTRMTGGCLEYADIAILLRSAFLSLLIEKALANAGIPYKMVGGRRFFDRVEVRILLDYLRVISHPDNNSALLSIINTPTRKVGDGTVAELNRASEAAKVSLWILVQKVLKREVSLEKKLSKPAEQGLGELVALIRKGQDKLKTFEPTQAPGKLIELVANALHFQDYLKKQYKEDWEDRWENVQELLLQAKDVTLQSLTAQDQLPEVDGVKQAQVEGSQEVLARFLANVALSTEVEADDESEVKPRITISTIHSAKGLEWPVVFVPAVYEGSIPHSRAEDTSEERRLLYVAMTRAKALLYMTFPIMQSRSESESILTQFLPSNVDHRLKDVGPVFNDQTVQDIATILQRSAPSQELLAHAATSLDESESQFDDIWPADGSPKGPFLNIETDMPTYYGRSAQSLAGAMRVNTTFQQRSNFSTVAGFTTASHQMSIIPPQKERVDQLAKPKLAKSSSGQGNLATFFSKGTLREVQIDNVPLPRLVGGSQTWSSAPAKPQPLSIPVELASHKPGAALASNPATTVKRPRPVLAETSNIEHRRTKRPYTCFSSSPTKEEFDNGALPQATVAEEEPHRPKYNTTMSTLQQSKSEPGYSSFKSGILNTMSRPTPLSSMSGTLSANGAMKKTLGVRRSLNGWADRKNK
ncbi:ATP-dependent DNA helicase srs2 [Exophiala xenobiotica]|uniref:DNA 3'-5' helicase n=1 Tax=Lithohypha guttulata TaxID=1690604 RepID=A0ABR0KN44_9EURO|nr:ATP-dependent DNA helicase srs2 [Lithohypha guttulata]KAK5329305.1 ATP-dependent DNA helicase srs2 [Exophiala xenobiotica]